MSNATNFIASPVEIGLLGNILNYIDFESQVALKTASASCYELFNSREPLLQLPQVKAISNLTPRDIKYLNNYSLEQYERRERYSHLFSVPMYQPIKNIFRVVNNFLFGKVTERDTSPPPFHVDRLFSFPVVRRFHEKLDPNGKILGRYLTEVLQVKCEKDPEDMIAFLQSFSLDARETIQSLNFFKSSITDEQVSQVLTLCPNIKVLNLGGTNITGEGFADLPANNKLENLSLNRCSHLDEGYLSAFFVKAHNLTYLDCSYTDTTGEGLADLPENNKLQTLRLNWCNRLDEEHLSRFFAKGNNLDTISISNTRITGRGLAHLPIDNQLKNLYLHSCGMLNLEHLTALFGKTNLLEVVYLNETNINLDQLFRERFAHISFYK
ncbi:MAG: hypothetical protein COT84_05945 [Chlamydiae bacterium CG10_big_fil_rev_8_21_14_0_10_35_9]|nr:MAG: hypothetical protein COT84_05945 [Chlamydiae bacterium CG10_big_fil_rev_8_21_14_0_10_35_9]